MAQILKNRLIKLCGEILQERIRVAEDAMNEAQEAANGEEKSSAGDKYETARAMGQISREMNARQLAEARTEWNQFTKLDFNTTSRVVINGSLVQTNQGYYFIAASVGPVCIEDEQIIVLSAKAPLANLMLGKETGERFIFNNKNFVIEDII